MISGQSLNCPKGASLTFEIDMDTGSDLTGATAQWALCESWFDQAKVYLTKTGAGDGLFIGQDAGVWKITVNLSPTDTIDVPSGLLYHDCKVLLQSGDVEDVANGPFYLDPSVNILNTNAPITRNLHALQALGRPSQVVALTAGQLTRNLLASQSLGGLGQSASGTIPLSPAAQMLAGYTQGLAIDLVNNSAAVKDTGAPSNNFDGTATSLLTLNGSAPSIGPNGGPLLTSSTYYTLLVGAFPFNISEGTLMLEFVRQSTASWGQFCQISTGIFDDSLSIRSGAAPAFTRFIINGIPSDYAGGDGIPQTVAGAYKLNDSAVSFNGGPAPKITSVTPGNSGATSLFMEGYTGDSTAVEFLRLVYIPQRLDEVTLASFRPTTPRTFHVDPISGSDSNDGLTVGAAKQTIASVLSGIVRGGDSVAIKGGTTARESTLGFPGGSIITSYGTSKGKISGARIISSGAWVADGTYANVKKAAITQTVTVAGLFYPMIWDDDAKLTYYIAGADIAANRAYVDTHPGTFTCHQTGSAVSNPQTDSNGTSYTYYVHLADGSDPASSVMEYAEQVNIITLVGGENLSNVIVQRTSAKDMINKDRGNLPFYSNNADFLEAAVHAIVGSPAHHTGSTATALPSSTPLGAGGGFHFFRDEAVDGPALICSATNCTATGFDKGFYSHGTGGGIEQVEVDLTDCASVNCSIGIQSGKTTNGWHITRHTHTSCTNPDVLQPNDVVIP